MHAWAAGLLQGESVQSADGMSGEGRGHFGGGGGGNKNNNTKQYKTKEWDRFAAIVQSLQGGVSGVLSQTEAAARSEWQSEGLASPREKGSAYCKQRDVRADLH